MKVRSLAALLCTTGLLQALSGGVLHAQSLPRANRILIEKRFQQQAWIGGDARAPTPQEWTRSGLTAATMGPAGFDAAFLDASPSAQWGLALAPYGGKLAAMPTEQERRQGFLPAEARAYGARLNSLQFGDEEAYSDLQVQIDAAWIGLSQRLYPDALAFTNQGWYQWSAEQLAYYLRTAKPDLLAFDLYYFPGLAGVLRTGSRPEVYDALNKYRRVALLGDDGSGKTPVPFGQFLQGYKRGYPADDGDYILSESEINLDACASWTMGAKWTSIFRWQTKPSTVFYQPDGSLSPQFHQYAKLTGLGNKLGPYLVRMDSSSVFIRPGIHPILGALWPLPNTPPLTVPVWMPDAGIVAGLEARNVGGANAGWPGDVLIGYFHAIPGLGSHASGYGLPEGAGAFFTDPRTTMFMVLNGLTLPNRQPADPNSTGGTAAETAQEITVSLDREQSAEGRTVWQVNPNTGGYEKVDTRRVSGRLLFTTTLPGGMAALFFVASGSPPGSLR